MAWTPPRLASTLPLALLLLAVVATGCADPASDPRANGPESRNAPGEPKGYCPLPEEQRATPSPCITFDWDARVAENHAYREPMQITEEQKKQATPRAEALATALRKLAETGTTEDGLRAAAADALGLRPVEIETRGDTFAPLRDVLVGGGEGKVCVNGRVDSTGQAEAEVVGRTNDGTCLPGLGGH
ncbi:precorrin-3B C(17)-methyltransferase [Streptomyces sp. GMY02]|uniref:precorrin-3B C(17)-methyltransferase n=1 Tax=Streptomyces sp. GMY02 TaxID=1333528 RepID=UPI001C2C9E01|nr:precorrin-3B C(17)-methyltransferase [Streptomyces sp. GMY02]QXE37162.1 precorrin-3B C(17)-methyltransferase [Streptomyces sp. GMY02]